ncbi:MAG TPA: hypothetical protein VNO33_17360 [Kofleriaceae bacterium]|nr:hypothetical protein [Kofleriaceae bacterium]
MGTKDRSENQGEGNRDAARRYNTGVQKHARSGESQPAADRARQDVEGPDAERLREAEQEGKSRMAEEDPEVEALPEERTDRTVKRGSD